MAISDRCLWLAIFPLCAHAGPTQVFMPEGSVDVFAGVAAVQGEATTVLPSFSAQWANGVFGSIGRDGLNAGMHLSDDPEFEYGPQWSLRGADQRNGEGRGVQGEAGGFLIWHWDRSLSLDTRIVRAAGNGQRGLVGVVSANIGRQLSTHHSLQLTVGAVLANRAYARAQGDGPQQAGVLSSFAGGEWHWQLANKYTLASGLTVSHVTGSGQHHGVAYTALSYHF